MMLHKRSLMTMSSAIDAKRQLLVSDSFIRRGLTPSPIDKVFVWHFSKLKFPLNTKQNYTPYFFRHLFFVYTVTLT